MVSAIAPAAARLPVATLWHVRSDGSSVVVPARPAQAINASFRHLQLLPDVQVRSSPPLFKLKVLDSMIEEASRAQRDGGSGVATAYRAGRFPLPGALADLVA
jgi:hypothetical protein